MPAQHLIAQKYLEALAALATDADKVVFMPYEASGVLASLGGIKEMLQALPTPPPGEVDADRAPMLNLLYALPSWLSGVVILAIVVGLSVGGLLLTRRHVLSRIIFGHEHGHFGGTMIHSIMIFYGLVAALIAVDALGAPQRRGENRLAGSRRGGGALP